MFPNSVNTLNMTERQIGWLAGIMDGEGYIAIHKVWANDRNGYRFSVRLVVTNTNYEICQRCKDLCGGGIYAKRKREGQKVVYQWYLYNVDKIVEILKLIVDDLIQKKELAELLIMFGDAYISNGGYKKRIKPATLLKQNELYETAKILNRRGDTEPSIGVNPRACVETMGKPPEMGEDIVRADMKVSECNRNDCTLA